MEVVIEKMNHQGMGIAKVNGKVIFIPKVIIGDIVDIDIVCEYKNYSIGKINKIIKNSSKRVDILCPYYDICGGCNMSSCSYDDELDYKVNNVIDIFRKNNIDVKPLIIKSDSRYNYRNKITLQVCNGVLGLYEENSNKLVDIDKCLLVSREVNDVIKIINDNIDLKKCFKIVIRDTSTGIMVIFNGLVNRDEVIKCLGEKVISIYTYNGNYKLIYGEKYLYENIGKYRYRISPDSFFQVNKDTVIKLYDKVKEYAKNNNKGKLLDLYCGTGTIGIYLSEYFSEIIGVELNGQAIEDAKYNAKLNDINNVEYYVGDVAKIINDRFTADVIVIDPPRSGLNKITKEVILKIKPEKIVYVSCNSITLARDINDLKNEYCLIDMTLVDMFPNTYHVESLVVLERIVK